MTEELVQHLFTIVASLGDAAVGATLEELSQKTGILKITLSRLLPVIETEGLIRFDARKSRYFPASPHLNLTGMPKNELIRRIYLSALKRSGAVAEKKYHSDDALFFVSAASVRQKDLPRFKRELRELLLRYIDKKMEETEKPDTVVYFQGAMFSARD